MGLYGAFDLHSSNSYVALVDQAGKLIFKRRLANRVPIILDTLERYRKDIVGLAVESTYNWYWLVDTLMEQGYRVHLANPAAMQKYKGIKHSDDKDDAIWLADMLRLGILPEGYIYPKQDRAVRDLLRKRGHLVQLRTALINSLQNTIARQCGFRVTANDIRRVKGNKIQILLEEQAEEVLIVGQLSKETIDFISEKIRTIERVVERKIALRSNYQMLRTMPGVGKILALTIMLETGPISRFAHAGKYVSYCRKVSSQWTSNSKRKGKGNIKNGNGYLSWAFAEAAEFARRYDPRAKAYYNRKAQKTKSIVAQHALSHKLARAAFYMMKNQEPFMADKVFS
jgi:transposase